MHLQAGMLSLSNGKGNLPLVLAWPWELLQTVVIHWTGTEYEAIATYKREQADRIPTGEQVAGIDLGEVHMAASYDGKHTNLLNGRSLRKQLREGAGL